jgi:hypothetical protein
MSTSFASKRARMRGAPTKRATHGSAGFSRTLSISVDPVRLKLVPHNLVVTSVEVLALKWRVAFLPVMEVASAVALASEAVRVDLWEVLCSPFTRLPVTSLFPPEIPIFTFISTALPELVCDEPTATVLPAELASDSTC